MQIQVNTDRHIDGHARLKDEVETIVQRSLSRYGDRITRVEVFLSDENSQVKFGDSDKRCVMEARLGGVRPISVTHLGSTLDQALNGAADKLEKSLRRAFGRKNSLFKRRARQREEMTAAGPLLQQKADSGQQEEFKQTLRPFLGHLGEHARRELRILEANGTLYPGQVAFSTLLDEVVTRAWLQYGDRPRWMAIDLWLTKIVDEILEEQTPEAVPAQGPEFAQLDEKSPQRVPQVGEQEWWMYLLGEGDSISEGAETVSAERTWAEHFLEAEDLIHRIHTLLGELPKERRHAFVLNVLEAYELAEIAMLQDRPEAEVRADVEAARDHLRKRLQAEDTMQTALEPAPEALIEGAEKS